MQTKLVPGAMLDDVKAKLFESSVAGHVDAHVAGYAELIRRTAFKGASDAYRLPFSDVSADICVKDATLRDKLRNGTITAEELESGGGLTAFGRELQKVVEGNMMLDLGCGGEQSTVPKELARAFGSPYIGMDNYPGFEERSEGGPTPRYYMKGEILETLAKLGRGGNNPDDVVLFLSGIELSYERSLIPGKSDAQYSEAYAEAFRAELNRIKPRAVVIGAGTSEALRPDETHFRRVALEEVWSNIGNEGFRTNEIWVPIDSLNDYTVPSSLAGAISDKEAERRRVDQVAADLYGNAGQA